MMMMEAFEAHKHAHQYVSVFFLFVCCSHALLIDTTRIPTRTHLEMIDLTRQRVSQQQAAILKTPGSKCQPLMIRTAHPSQTWYF